MKQPIDSKCRMHCNAGEHKKHIVAGCVTFAPSKYTNKQSKVAGYIHWKVCKHMGLQVTGTYCEHMPEKVINVNGTIVMWDVPVITDQAVLANQPSTVLHDKKEKTCLLLDIAIPDDSNVNTKETEKLKKKIVSVIIGALGTIKKGLYQYLLLLPGQPLAIELQKITLMSNAHSICRVLG